MQCNVKQMNNFRSSLPDNTNRHALYSHTRYLGLHSQDVRYIVIILGYGISGLVLGTSDCSVSLREYYVLD